MARLGPKDRVGPRIFGPKKTRLTRLDKNEARKRLVWPGSIKMKPEKNDSTVGPTRKRQPYLQYLSKISGEEAPTVIWPNFFLL